MPLGISDCSKSDKKASENKAVTAEHNLIMQYNKYLKEVACHLIVDGTLHYQ